MSKIKINDWSRRFILFSVGALVFLFLEVAWNAFTGAMVGFKGMKYLTMGGYSTLWMGIVGGIIFLLLGKMNEFSLIRDRLPLSLQCLIAALMVTILEFITGLIVNVWLGLHIWDYTGFPLAHLFLNQINLIHSILWFFVSILAFWLDDALRWVLYQLKACNSCNKIYSLLWLIRQLFSLKPPKMERLER